MHLHMRGLLASVLMACLFLAARNASAETRYVTNSIVVVVRSEPIDSGYEVLEKIRSNDSVTVLGAKESFTQVRTAKGTQGWVVNHYLTDTPPAESGNEAAKAEIRRLKARVAELEAAAKAGGGVKPDQVGGAAEAGSSSPASEDCSSLKEKYTRLLEQSRDVVALTEERNSLRSENSSLKAEADHLRIEKERSSRSGQLWWFLAGAGVLLVGWLIGRSARKTRRFY